MGSTSLEDGESLAGDSSVNAWDVAVRYHEFKAKPAYRKIADHLRDISAEAILGKAQEILGSIVHSAQAQTAPMNYLPLDATSVDLDLDETLEQNPLLPLKDSVVLDSDLWMSYQIRSHKALILTVDTSLSMTGEKLALTAVALAVVLLQFPDDPVGIVAFENEAKILKQIDEKISVFELISRFLDVPAQGYTHLEYGIKKTLAMITQLNQPDLEKSLSTVLLTDGKYTAGRDPSYLAARFSHLVVLKMGLERAGLSLCQELAKKGQGALKEVGDLDRLPQVMYGIVKDLIRGRTV